MLLLCKVFWCAESPTVSQIPPEASVGMRLKGSTCLYVSQPEEAWLVRESTPKEPRELGTPHLTFVSLRRACDGHCTRQMSPTVTKRGSWGSGVCSLIGAVQSTLCDQDATCKLGGSSLPHLSPWCPTQTTHLGPLRSI